jgi:hypothetical protein
VIQLQEEHNIEELVNCAQKAAKWMRKKMKKEKLPLVLLYQKKKYKKFKKQYDEITFSLRKDLEHQESKIYIPKFHLFIMWIIKKKISKGVPQQEVYEGFKKRNGIK